MSEKLSEFLLEHRASEFGLAPVSRALAIKMAVALEADLQRYQEKADAIHKYLSAKNNSALLAVITELSLDAERRAAQEKVNG